MSRKSQVFLRLKGKDKILLLEAFVLTGLFRMIILFMPFSKYKKHIGIYKKESSYQMAENKYTVIKKISWAVVTVSRYTPWESKCLVQALAAQAMLKRRKIDSTLYLGVNKGEKNRIIAHAWLRSGHLIVTGKEGNGEFVEVARFAVVCCD